MSGQFLIIMGYLWGEGGDDGSQAVYTYPNSNNPFFSARCARLTRDMPWSHAAGCGSINIPLESL